MKTDFRAPELKRRTRRLIVTISTLILLLVLGLSVLLGTHIGNRWLLAAAIRVEPRLAVTLESGILLGAATLSNLSWSSPGLDIQIPQLEWQWDWQCLQEDRLCLDLFRTQGGSVTLTDTPPAGENRHAADNGDLQLPFAIELRNLQLIQTKVDLYGHHISLGDLQGRVRFDNDGLLISTPKLRDLQVTLAATEPGAAAEAVGMSPRLLPEVDLPLKIRLNDFELQSGRINRAETAFLVHRLQLTAAAAGSKIELTSLALTTPEAKLQTNGRIDLSGGYPLKFDAALALLELPPVSGLDIDLTVSGSIADLAVELSAKGPLTGALSARAELLDPTLPFAVDLSWQNFNWPIEQPTVISEAGEVQITGSLEGYTFHLSGAASAEPFTNLNLVANGQGDTDQIQLTGLTLLALDGEAELSGLLRWRDELTWQGDLLLQRINPAELIRALPGRLNGRLQHTFRWRDGDWNLQIPKIALTGELSEQPFQLKGSVQGNQTGEWRFAHLQLLSGSNTLQVDGQIGVESDLTGKLDISDLQTSLEQSTGSASGLFTLAGQRDALQLDFSLTAKDLAHAGQKIGSLASNGKLTFNTTQYATQNPESIPSGSMQIQAEQISYHGYSFASLEALFSNDKAAQSLTLNLQGEKFSLQSSILGQLEHTLWSGQLQPSRLTTPFGDWRLESPLNLSYDIEQQRAIIDSHCWRSEPASLCLNEPAEIGKTGLLNMSLQNLNSVQLTDLLPQGLSWQGSLNANAVASWTPEQKARVNANLTAGSGRLGIEQAGQTVEGEYQQLELIASLDETRAQAELLFRSDQLGQADISLQLPRTREEQTLESAFHLSGFNLSVMRPLLEPLDELAGTIDADGKVFGSLKHPQISGKIVLHEGRMIAATLPFDIEKVNLQLRLSGDKGELDGDLLLGSGRMELAGSFNWAQQPMTGWLSLNGTRNRLRFDPELDLLIDPALRIELIEQQLNLTGNLQIPYGRAKIRTLPQGSVRISEDVVILDKPKSTRTEQALPLSLDVKVTLLEDVEIDAFGLKAQLEGRLALKQVANRPLTGNGSIDLREGTYRAFGQNLLIKKGYLIFAGPLAKPFIDVDAIRNPSVTSDNVTAGIRLTGEAQRPKVTIYSEPAMSQQEAISYLLRGRSLSDGSGSSQDTTVATMLIGVGIGSTEGTIGELGNTFGVEEMAVDTSGEGSDTQIKVSGYVLPGVQVGYGVGVFSPISVITIRYEILPKLILEASSGLQSAVDLLYEFEF